MTEFVTAWLGRILAAAIAGACAWLLVRYGITIDATTQQHLVEALVGIVLPVFVALYGVLHKLIDAKLNPGDAAAPSAVAETKAHARARAAARPR